MHLERHLTLGSTYDTTPFQCTVCPIGKLHQCANIILVGDFARWTIRADSEVRSLAWGSKRTLRDESLAVAHQTLDGTGYHLRHINDMRHQIAQSPQPRHFALKTPYRRESTWRVMAEYEGAIEGLRDDLRRAIADFGGDADQFTAQTPVSQLYDTVRELLGKAETTEDARRIQEFLDGFEAKTYDVYADLAQRSGEFDGIRSGATFPLDRHIDQDKLTEFLEQRFMDAMANADPTNQASRDEVAFYQQAHLAAKEGRNPLVDLGDQISYLRGKFDPSVPIDDLPEDLQITARQAQNFQLHQQELIDLLSDPAFHKSAAVMGDDTYAPVNFLRPELGNPPPVGVGDVQTRIFDSEVAQLGGGTDTVSGNYAANQQVINDRVGGNDFARVPEVPEGIEPQPAQAVEEAPQGPRGILRNADAGGGPLGLGEGRIINRGPDGENVPDEVMELWAQRMLGESNEAARGNQGGYGNYMDQMAELRTRHQQMEDRVALNPYAAARVGGGEPDVGRPARAGRSTAGGVGPRSGPQRHAELGSQWLAAAADGPCCGCANRSASAARTCGRCRSTRRTCARRATQFRDLDQGNAALSWWTGSGINRPTEALDADEAVRHVPAPRLATDRPSYPSSWRASRQPGFGRLADAPGTFPVNAREQMITETHAGQTARFEPHRPAAGHAQRRGARGPCPAPRMAEDERAAAQPARRRGAGRHEVVQPRARLEDARHHAGHAGVGRHRALRPTP